ncbi:hypothetical protein HR12_36085 [Microbacterium sp. SUBG005]|nr:hypothetical protein HR12_36085 [Microbacterium sp. SUBG005]
MLGLVRPALAEVDVTGPERCASAVGMEWVEKSTRIFSGAMPSATNADTASETPVTNVETKPGWSKNWRTLSMVTVSPSPVASSTRA